MIINVLGCHSPWTWSYDQGVTLNDSVTETIIALTDKPFVRGITFSGGDPLSERNREDTLKLLYELKRKLPTKDFWCWTGSLFEDIRDLSGIKNFDVIIDGKFEINKKDLTLPWRGSTNQRIIDVKKSLENNSVILYDPE